MLLVKTHRQFEKDLKRALKRGKDATALWQVIHFLQSDKMLASRHRPHKLQGEWVPFWECHIEPDWLLIYLKTDTHLELIRTGSHADLF